MSEDKRWYLVMYDIRDPKRWRRAHKIVRGFGYRVQLSIFRFRGTRRAMEELRCELERVLAEEDDLMVIELCPSCSERAISRHPDSGWKEDDGCTIL